MHHGKNRNIRIVMGQDKSKTGKKNSTTVHIEMPLDLEKWIKVVAKGEVRSMRNMVLILLMEARKAREPK